MSGAACCVCGLSPSRTTIVAGEVCWKADGELIAHAPDDIAWLLMELEQALSKR
jgi:hypothetical protein